MVKKRRGNRLPAITLVLVLIIALVFALPYVREATSTKSQDGDLVTISVPQGASTESIGKILKENELIKSVNIFKLRAHMDDNGARMNYGTFKLHKGMCIPDIIDTLAGTYSYRPTVTFTVPEGFSVQQIAERAEDLGLSEKDDFLEALNDDYDYGFLKNVPEVEGAHYRLQGFLYPETYEFYTDASAHDIIDKMLGQFEKEIKDLKIKGKDIYEIVTVASLLEREALLDSEMPTIAGVIYNRIEKGMRLQIDATVQYAVTKGEYNINRVTYKDLEIDSPYNTYKIDTLPVGPISSVSINALKAAANPEKHEYLYYHTDTVKNDGSHIFTKTYSEHLSTMK